MASTQRNIEMFGIADIDEFVASVKESITYKFSGMPMVIMSILSDSQEEMARGQTEKARQTINIAKYLLSLKS